MGPVGDGVAEGAAVGEAEPEAGNVESFRYVVNRLAPPQYSVELPLQVIEHPFCVGSLPPAAKAEPVPKLFPQ